MLLGCLWNCKIYLRKSCIASLTSVAFAVGVFVVREDFYWYSWPMKKITVSPKLLEILVCPVTYQPLVWDKKKNELISANLAYPIKNGVPILLPEEARKLS